MDSTYWVPLGCLGRFLGFGMGTPAPAAVRGELTSVPTIICTASWLRRAAHSQRPSPSALREATAEKQRVGGDVHAHESDWSEGFWQNSGKSGTHWCSGVLASGAWPRIWSCTASCRGAKLLGPCLCTLTTDHRALLSSTFHSSSTQSRPFFALTDGTSLLDREADPRGMSPDVTK